MGAPLTPADCDLQDFPRMMIDIPRLFSSEFDSTDNDSAWRFGVTLWLKSFHQVPAASLPDDDAALARLCGLGRDVRTWRQCKEVALRGWMKCDDGLLYHPVVAEVALEAWLEKLTQRLSSGAGNAARWGTEFDPEPIRAEIGIAAKLLQALNPKSKALSKQQAALALRKSQRETPSEVPSGPDECPNGIAKQVPSGSQGKGRERIEEDSDPDGSGAEAPVDDADEDLDPLAELRGLPVAKGSWRLAVKVLVEQGRMTDPKARTFVGKLKSGGLSDAELWEIAEAAFSEQTEDPVPYLTRAAQRAIERRASAPPRSTFGPRLRNPPEDQQRGWMRDFRDGFEWKQHDRGPRPGEPGCQVSPEIQREFGVEPAPPQAVKGAA